MRVSSRQQKRRPTRPAGEMPQVCTTLAAGCAGVTTIQARRRCGYTAEGLLGPSHPPTWRDLLRMWEESRVQVVHSAPHTPPQSACRSSPLQPVLRLQRP